MRRCIKEPISEVYAAWQAMSAAVDEHLKGNIVRAQELFQKADCPIVWKWLNSSWTGVVKNVVEPRPVGDTHVVPKAERDPDRNIDPHVREAVLKRDGYRCRYCGIPVVHADIRKIAAKLYPFSVPWNSRDPAKQHAGFQSLWLQFDHVEPHSHGGRSNVENVVISCALCNFGKDRFTLRQLGLEDPRRREAEPNDFDGLERMRACPMPASNQFSIKRTVAMSYGNDQQHDSPVRYFLAGAWISSGYLNTQPIDGKKRWFKLGDYIHAEQARRDGIGGCILVCRPVEFVKRGIDGSRFRDQGDPDKN